MLDTTVSIGRSICSRAASICAKADAVLQHAAVWTAHLGTVGKLGGLLDFSKEEYMEDWERRYQNASDLMTALASNATSIADTGSKWVSSHTPSTVSSIFSGVTSYASSLEPSALAWGAAGLTAAALACRYLTGGSESQVTEEGPKTTSPTEDKGMSVHDATNVPIGQTKKSKTGAIAKSSCTA